MESLASKDLDYLNIQLIKSFQCYFEFEYFEQEADKNDENMSSRYFEKQKEYNSMCMCNKEVMRSIIK